MNISALTRRYSGISRVIESPIEILIPGTDKLIKTTGLWDTGATGTAITSKAVKLLNLYPTGMAQVSTAAGIVTQDTYSIDVILPNGVKIGGIVATEVPSLNGKCEALIGMDVICLGDFSITNHSGCTCFSFRVPSSHEIDYVKSPDFGIVKIENVSEPKKIQAHPNSKCPCGSGEKYKRCHGKR